MANPKDKLSPEELEMEHAALEGANGSPSEERLDKLRVSAQATLDERKKPVNIRLDLADLAALKERAADSGLGYQTLIASVLHRFLVGGLVDREIVNELKLVYSGAGDQAAISKHPKAKRQGARGKTKAAEKRIQRSR